MSRARVLQLTIALAALAAAIATSGARTYGQTAGQPTNDAPNPYQSIEGYFKLPEGRTWGSTSAVEIDKDGKSIWIAERCGLNGCLDRASGQMSTLDPILHFDASGKLIKSFGSGLLIFPHGIFVDRDGNIWVTDGQDNAPLPQRGAGAGRGAGGAGAAAAAGAGRPAGPIGPREGATKGNQVYKFSPDGKLLLTLGKPGGAAAPDYFYQPNDVLVAPNGDIFVSEGHGAGNNRVLKFDKTGKFIKEWGKLGTGPGEFDQPHALAMDSRGRLFVGDRNNNRVQIFDQNGTFIDAWTQYSRPSGLFIDKQDNLYVADSESESVSRNHNGWKRGIRYGRIKDGKDGKIIAFIPDPDEKATGTSAAEGVAVDSSGNIYGAEVGPKRAMKYAKK
ncbi:MAG TPA: peptidyl-alpha-hydroxyglycine alpha-amidating lyase family protein [Vicinamibacterales bacterium]|jgi:streptogramin lyase|nr:peptidyl-alpha-hydroxyglycine alpha-amidating lyase family protein [Vicinamibacterales bacterium]